MRQQADADTATEMTLAGDIVPPVPFRNRTDLTVTLDRRGTIVDITPACAALLDATGGSLQGKPIADYLDGFAARTLVMGIDSYACLGDAAVGRAFRLESVGLFGKNLPKRRVELTGRHLWIDGEPAIVLSIQQVREGMPIHPRVSRKLGRFGSLGKLAPVGILHLAPDGSCLSVNDRWVEASGLDANESLGFGWIDALEPAGEESADELPSDPLPDGFHGEREFVLRSVDGKATRVALGTTTLFDENGRINGFLLVLTDISEKHFLLERLHTLASTDSLTGLANRGACLDRLDQALAPRHDAVRVAVLYLDLDAFKAVNDTLGHDHGDELLRAVAARLRGLVRREDSVARLGGDEFIVLRHGADARSASSLAEEIVETIGRPYRLFDREARVSASVGIAIGTPGAIDSAALFRQADTALYAAKRTGRARHAFYDRDLDHAESASGDFEQANPPRRPDAEPATVSPRPASTTRREREEADLCA